MSKSYDSKSFDFEDQLRKIENYNVESERKNLKLSNPVGVSATKPIGNFSDNITKISKNTTVTGNINSDSPIFVDGRIKGNIKTTADAGINGLINGDIEAKNIHYQHAGVNGNSVAFGDTSIEKEGVIVGNITTSNLAIDGKVKGKIDVLGKATLEKNCLVSGEIAASEISIKDGARISASITIVSHDTIDEEAFNLGLAEE